MGKTLNSFEFVNTFWEGKKGYVFMPRLTKDGGWIEGEPIFYSKSTLDDVKEKALSFENTDENVYFSPSVFSRQKRMNKNSTPTEWLWADTDDGHVDLPLPPTILVSTSEKSFQSYWKLTHLLTPEQHNALNRIVNWSQEADRNGWGMTKVLRVVGTNNYKKDKSYRVKLSHNNDMIYTPEKMMEAALNNFDRTWIKNFGVGKFNEAIKMFGKHIYWNRKEYF